jgi:hypothetical protein
MSPDTHRALPSLIVSFSFKLDLFSTVIMDTAQKQLLISPSSLVFVHAFQCYINMDFNIEATFYLFCGLAPRPGTSRNRKSFARLRYVVRI